MRGGNGAKVMEIAKQQPGYDDVAKNEMSRDFERGPGCSKHVMGSWIGGVGTRRRDRRRTKSLTDKFLRR